MRCKKPMKSRFADIDNAIKVYIANEISMEKNKELEELVFFSSYTIKFDVFKKPLKNSKKYYVKNFHMNGMYGMKMLHISLKNTNSM